MFAPQTKDISEIAKKLAASPKSNSTPRIVVITQGSSSTIVATSDSSSTETYPVEALEKEKIVDTNGAGDAFAGGFLGARALGKDVKESVEVGHKMGRMNVQLSGPTFKFPKEQIV
jgi:adenosine kinase